MLKQALVRANAHSARPSYKMHGSGSTGELDVIRKEAWPFYRMISSVRLCWEIEKSEGSQGMLPSNP